ncbi:uncharacterized protein LOC110850149 isoform X2 [Folsomia candida]|uniref:uncharacterized protein LOC110850149 isoform X2 n=1 Tax=Folsomia candida TaxID=158441 RepID=UPI0016052A85|nr:uncharacterized protein LOC110850149 isoform X2 [Folsomia candida]
MATRTALLNALMPVCVGVLIMLPNSLSRPANHMSPLDVGHVLVVSGKCVCPHGFGLWEQNATCIPCPLEEVNERVTTPDGGMIIDNLGKCICPIDHKYILRNGYCQPICVVDDDCPDDKFCYAKNSTCITPCLMDVCPTTAHCTAIRHAAICRCPEGTKGYPTPDEGCVRPTLPRLDFPSPNMRVNCLADGVQVDIDIHKTEPYATFGEFNGFLYVEGFSEDPNCRKSDPPLDDRPVDFKVKFGTCGTKLKDGEVGFVLVIQRYPKLVTFTPQTFPIKCLYMTGEKPVGLNASMMDTSPPPTCLMKIVTATGGEITSAEIGETMLLRVEVQPQTIYSGFPRNCVAKIMAGDAKNEYLVTDENGCATDPTAFGEWEVDHNNSLLLAHFNVFKFLTSGRIKFQCNVKVCFGECQRFNCRDQIGFGGRKQQIFQDRDASLSTSFPDYYVGQVRKEVTVESNPILVLERRAEQRTNLSEGRRP